MANNYSHDNLSIMIPFSSNRSHGVGHVFEQYWVNETTEALLLKGVINIYSIFVLPKLFQKRQD